MAMSLVAFAFMGGGGIGTALGGRLIKSGGFSLLYGVYALALAVLVVFAFIVVRDVGEANTKPATLRAGQEAGR